MRHNFSIEWCNLENKFVSLLSISALVLTSNEEIVDVSLNINMWEIAYLFEKDVFLFMLAFESKGGYRINLCV